jgi:hypothetical protein
MVSECAIPAVQSYPKFNPHSNLQTWAAGLWTQIEGYGIEKDPQQ